MAGAKHKKKQPRKTEEPCRTGIDSLEAADREERRINSAACSIQQWWRAGRTLPRAGHGTQQLLKIEFTPYGKLLPRCWWFGWARGGWGGLSDSGDSWLAQNAWERILPSPRIPPPSNNARSNGFLLLIHASAKRRIVVAGVAVTSVVRFLLLSNAGVVPAKDKLGSKALVHKTYFALSLQWTPVSVPGPTPGYAAM